MIFSQLLLIYLMKNISETTSLYVTIIDMADDFGKTLYHFVIITKLVCNKQLQNLIGIEQYMFISYKSGIS